MPSSDSSANNATGQSFGNALPKVRFGVKSGSLRKADLLGW